MAREAAKAAKRADHVAHIVASSPTVESLDDRRVIEKAAQIAQRAVKAAAEAALRHFREGVTVEKKADASPVTVADREAEAAMLDVIRGEFPDHAVLGEETGKHAGDDAWRWICDPIDGTRGYTRGGPFWGPLVALEHGGRVVVGAFALPVLGESYWGARGLGAWQDGRKLSVSTVAAVSEATVCIGEPKAFVQPALVGGMTRLMKDAAAVRVPGDLGGGAYVLSGRADAWIESGVQIWDVAPFQVIVEEAGGMFTDMSGKATIANGSAVVTNGRVHAEILAAFAGAGGGAK
jgi:histidinol-phosphatase